MRTFHKGGVHPPECKLTAGMAPVEVELPREVILALSQHIGAPAKPVVEKGTHVARGQMVAEAGGFVSAPVHTPISGTVTRIDKSRTPQGAAVDTITIVADDADHAADLEARRNPPVALSPDQIMALEPEQIVARIADAGIVGLGGATFPTKVKLMPPPGSVADILIINAVECEPYLTNDHALMLTQPDAIMLGVRALMRAAKVERAVIGIEANKPDAIALLTVKAAAYPGIEVMPLKVKYPQGGEKQLIEAVTGREVPSGALPIAAGAIVQNVATAFAVATALTTGEPLMERIITVTGPSVSAPGNYIVPLGYSMRALVELAGGVPSDTGKIIIGGPMMGRSAVTVDSFTTKGVSGILMLPESMSERRPADPCIRCAACVSACPMGLRPYLISTLSRLSDWDGAEAQGVMNCIECGCCSYSCPASRPILDYIRLGKTTVGGIIRARAAKKQ